jgi:hypothetical protein
MKKFLFLYFLTFWSLSANSQERKTGIINDPDGYTNIRTGKGSSFEVIEKLYTDELFAYVDSTNQNWLKIWITKCNCDTPHRLYNQIEGYVHRSRIQDVDELPRVKRKLLFSKIFETELELYNKFINATDRSSKEYQLLNGKRKVFHDYQFDGSLRSFTNYACEFKDEELVGQYINLMESQEGSADEAPTYALGRMFVCDPDWTFKQIRSHMTLMDQLEWGLVNVIYRMPNEEADEHKRKYNKLRTAIGMSKVDFAMYEE